MTSIFVKKKKSVKIQKCMYTIKYNILKRILVKNQNPLNMHKIIYWFSTNAKLLIQGIYNNSVLNL